MRPVLSQFQLIGMEMLLRQPTCMQHSRVALKQNGDGCCTMKAVAVVRQNNYDSAPTII